MTDLPSTMVDRVVLILEVFERSCGKLTLGQVTSRSGLPRSSAHRILQQLVDSRLLHRIENEYTLGLRMFEIGSLVVGRSRLLALARPLVQDLAAKTGHVAHLALLDRNDVLYLEKVGGGAVARALPSRVGGRFPAHATGIGKVMLAYSARSVVEDYLEQGLDGPAGASVPTPTRLMATLSRIKELGYVVEHEPTAPGIVCLAAPILEADTAVAAISVCGPRPHLRLDDLRCRVMSATAEISRGLSVGSYPYVGRIGRPTPGHLRPEAATIPA